MRLRDPIQELIDKHMRGLAGKWGDPPPQKNCHPHGGLEGDIAEAIDEKTELGGYDE
jgi:hypothetical protein